MNLSQISKWLRKTPQPATIVLDGTKRLAVGPGGGKWAEMARSIEAAGATKLEALDGQGNLLRATVMDDSGDDPSEKTSELQSDLQVLSKIIADAYEKGTQAPSKLLESAMGFIERQGQRLVAQDREIERLRAVNAKLSAQLLQLQAGATEADPDDGLLGAIIQGALQGQAAIPADASPPTPPNGVHQPKRK